MYQIEEIDGLCPGIQSCGDAKTRGNEFAKKMERRSYQV
jgi:hypothetical protein